MRETPLEILEKMRIYGIEKRTPFLTDYMIKNEGNTGIFELREKDTGRRFFIISSDSGGWDHVSVHIFSKGKKIKVPSWSDMCHIKNLFFDPEEVVIQFHPRQSEYVNIHPGTLHLWKKQGEEFPTPPVSML